MKKKNPPKWLQKSESIANEWANEEWAQWKSKQAKRDQRNEKGRRRRSRNKEPFWVN